MGKTLLDGFGEATDEVVALRAEVARLKADYQANADAVVEQLRTRDADNKQLHGDIDRLSDHYQKLMAECDQKDAVIERLQRERNVWETRARTAEGRYDPL